jgi:hypothetical protein
VEWAIDSEKWRARLETVAAWPDMGAPREGKDAARRVMVDEREGKEGEREGKAVDATQRLRSLGTRRKNGRTRKLHDAKCSVNAWTRMPFTAKRLLSSRKWSVSAP